MPLVFSYYDIFFFVFGHDCAAPVKASGKAHRSLWWVGALYLYSDQLL